VEKWGIKKCSCFSTRTQGGWDRSGFGKAYKQWLERG